MASLLAATIPHETAAWTYINTNTGDGSCVVSLTGEMTLTDADLFEAVTSDCQGGGVLLESKGGSLEAGLRIGELIRQRSMETAVAYDAMCASACAIAWLGGVRRNIFETSLVGFHAAYVLDEGVPKESGVGNALVGSYLAHLGLPREAVIFIASAAPKDMNWLDYRAVSGLGITINILAGDDRSWIDTIRQNDPHYAEEAARQ